MWATHHFQDPITRLSQSDSGVCILWSRLPTGLPLMPYRREGGTPHLFGTEFEFEEAAGLSEQKAPHTT